MFRGLVAARGKIINMRDKRVAVIRGGPSDEYEVSMQTGASVLEALRTLDYFAKDIVVSRGGEWLENGIIREPNQALQAIDVVFLALHGNFGEDGAIQRILEQEHIPFTGSRAFASNMALNKDIAKNYLKQFGVKMPKHLKVTRSATRDPYRTAESITQLFGPKYVIKPVNSGSSLGASMVDREVDLALALTNALTEFEEVLVEEQISGKEATVGLTENYRGQSLYLLPVIEIVPPKEARFFDYQSKYSGVTEEICPGRFSDTERGELQRLAKLVHQELGLQQYSRSDFIVKDGDAYFLEVNTLPGLTKESLFPKAFQAIGSSYNDMIKHLVETARV